MYDMRIETWNKTEELSIKYYWDERYMDNRLITCSVARIVSKILETYLLRFKIFGTLIQQW